ncbi:hypothetical protein F8197_05995 [Duganella sp. FT27W]|nr:hypothetical protein [Duganella sp. FT27W]
MRNHVQRWNGAGAALTRQRKGQRFRIMDMEVEEISLLLENHAPGAENLAFDYQHVDVRFAMRISRRVRSA